MNIITNYLFNQYIKTVVNNTISITLETKIMDYFIIKFFYSTFKITTQNIRINK